MLVLTGSAIPFDLRHDTSTYWKPRKINFCYFQREYLSNYDYL